MSEPSEERERLAIKLCDIGISNWEDPYSENQKREAFRKMADFILQREAGLRDHIRQELIRERGEDWKECYCSSNPGDKCSVCFLSQALTGTTEKEKP